MRWKRTCPLVGIELNAGYVRVGRLAAGERGLAELTVAEKPLPYGAFESGRVQDQPLVASALNAALQTVLGARFSKKVRGVLAVSRNDVFITELELCTDLSSRQIQQHIELALEQQLGVNPEQLYLDYEVLTTADRAVVDQHNSDIGNVTVVACHRSMVDAYLALAAQAKIDIVSVEVDSDSQLRGAAVLSPDTLPSIRLEGDNELSADRGVSQLSVVAGLAAYGRSTVEAQSLCC